MFLGVMCSSVCGVTLSLSWQSSLAQVGLSKALDSVPKYLYRVLDGRTLGYHSEDRRVDSRRDQAYFQLTLRGDKLKVTPQTSLTNLPQVVETCIKLVGKNTWL